MKFVIGRAWNHGEIGCGWVGGGLDGTNSCFVVFLNEPVLEKSMFKIVSFPLYDSC